MTEQRLSLEVPGHGTVGAILDLPERPAAVVVFAHGAGAGMEHAFMGAVAQGLAARRIATLRYQFPFMESGSRRPDRPPLAHAAVRAAVSTASSLLPDLPLFAGGKSFGGRMTSQAEAIDPLPNLRGLVFFGFPLHQPGKPTLDRAAHLAQVRVPMLFIQGTKDKLADIDLIRGVADQLEEASLLVVEDADHAFHVPVRSGRTDAAVLQEMIDGACEWMASRL